MIKEKLLQFTSYIEKLSRQDDKINNQIDNQSNDAIRTLLLELESGGNARFEDEQKNSQWVSHCEKQIKKFIKRAASKDSPKTIQIHRISRLFNRGAKLKFEERLEKVGNADKSNYLCSTVNLGNDEVFKIAECGFESNQLLMTNYFDCHDQKSGNNYLRKVVIVRTSQLQTQEVSEDISTDQFLAVSNSDFPAADGVSQRVYLHDVQSPPADFPRRYMVFNEDCILPEYLVEYSLDSDFHASTNQIQRLILDISFSNRISHSNMPMVVHELSSKTKKPELVSIYNQGFINLIIATIFSIQYIRESDFSRT